MNSDVKDIYCLDSSAFITMHRYYSIDMVSDLWGHLESLFKENQLISHQVVFDEIVPKQGQKDELATWLIGFQSYFRKETQRQLELFPDILTNFPKLIDPNSEKEQADPYLIAMLREIMESEGLFGEQSDYIIVSTESEKSSIKLPAACKHYNIRHMNLFQFFSANNFSFSVTRS